MIQQDKEQKDFFTVKEPAFYSIPNEAKGKGTIRVDKITYMVYNQKKWRSEVDALVIDELPVGINNEIS